MLITRFSIHVYDSDLSIQVCLSLDATWHSPYYSLGSSDSPGSSRPLLQSLELVDSPGCWSEWHSNSVDHRQTIWSPILLGPLCVSRVFLLQTCERLLYCSYLYISLYSRICAYRWYNILIILCHILWKFCNCTHMLECIMHHVLSYYDSYLYWCLAFVCEGIFDLRIYVVVTSP